MPKGSLSNVPGLKYVRQEQMSDPWDTTVRGDCEKVRRREYRWIAGEVTTQAWFRDYYRITNPEAYLKWDRRFAILTSTAVTSIGFAMATRLIRRRNISLVVAAVTAGIVFFLMEEITFACAQNFTKKDIRKGGVYSTAEIRWIEKRRIDENPPAGGSHCSPVSTVIIQTE
ncbi:MAG: hypothetical protein HYT77_02810 [Deltaproteobacteria bacterium]|nr:hypothetical protein [Deltaproteobacteria bacterium]